MSNTGGELNARANDWAENLVEAAALGDLIKVKTVVNSLVSTKESVGGLGSDNNGKDSDLLLWTGFNELIMEPLTAAAMAGRLQVVDYLLSLDQTGQLSIGDGKLCEGVFAAAAAGGHIDILKSLHHMAGVQRDFGVNEKPAIVQAASNGHVETVEFLLTNDLSTVNQRKSNQYEQTYGGDVTRSTALWAACNDVAMETARREAVVRTLIDRGADQNATAYGETPLKLAIKNKHHSVADILRAAGATIISDKKGETKSKKKIDVSSFAALNLKLAVPSKIVQSSRDKGSITK